MGRTTTTKRRLSKLNFNKSISKDIIFQSAIHDTHPNTMTILEMVKDFSRMRKEVAEHAACDGNLTLLKWTTNDGDLYQKNENLLRYAASEGHYDVVKWLHGKEYKYSKELTAFDAAYDGHKRVVRWLQKRNVKKMDASICKTLSQAIEDAEDDDAERTKRRKKTLRWIERSGECSCGGIWH